jgi:adenine-specific DNA methylase
VSRLADEVRKWGEWVKQEAIKELGEFYPKDPDGATPIAYLWARTIQCEGPGCGAEVPLIRSIWLAKKANRSVALQLVPRPEAKRVDFQIIVKHRGGWVDQADPTTKVENPQFASTVKRGSATCPCCGYTTPVGHVREQLKVRTGGASDARMMCVASVTAKSEGRVYRLPMTRDLAAIDTAARELRRRIAAHSGSVRLIPDDSISLNEIRRINVPLYGMTRWSDIFSSRQLLALTTMTRLVNEVGLKLRQEHDAGFAAAVQTCLAFAVSKESDLTNSLCSWKPDAECPVHMMARQAIPMLWDFAEAVAISESSGSWSSMIERTTYAIDSAFMPSEDTGHTVQCSAASHVLPEDSAHAFITDPPYYDAVPYAYLSDFFYVWLRRSLATVHADLFREAVVPKDEEIVVDRPHELSNSTHDIAYYERELTRAFVEGRRVLRPDGVGTVVFASKTTASWEAILKAVVEAGWIISGSWPIDTEMDTRVSAQGQARLASSVHLVCRPRENPDGSVRTDEVGDWRDVLAELPRRIHAWMPRLADEGVVGADAIFACLGPALEVFSRYARVEKASGEAVTLKEYLEQVWAVVSTEALSMIFDDADAAGLEPDARLTAMWLWTVGSGKPPNSQAISDGDDHDDDDNDGDNDGDDDEQVDAKKKPTVKGFSLEFDAARKIAQGLGIHLDRSPSIVEVKGDTARLLPVAERTPYLFGKDTPGASSPTRPRRTKQRKLFEELEAVEAAASGTGIAGSSISRPRPGQTVLDRTHQAMILFGANRGEALKQFLVDDGVGRDGRFWKLAQALSALYPSSTDEKRWVDGVLARKKGMGL